MIEQFTHDRGLRIRYLETHRPPRPAARSLSPGFTDYADAVMAYEGMAVTITLLR